MQLVKNVLTPNCFSRDIDGISSVPYFLATSWLRNPWMAPKKLNLTLRRLETSEKRERKKSELFCLLNNLKKSRVFRPAKGIIGFIFLARRACVY
jgi:hypothetical protein